MTDTKRERYEAVDELPVEMAQVSGETDAKTQMTEAVRARTSLLLGDAFLRKERAYIYLDRALEAYKAAGAVIPQEVLLKIGDAALSAGSLDYALNAYRAAGAKEKLIIVGDEYVRSMSMGCYAAALKAYKAAGANDKILAMADACWKWPSGYVKDAVNAYEAVGHPLPKEEFIAVADESLQEGRIGYAVSLYTAAGVLPKERLITTGDVLLEKGQAHSALQAYTAAGATEKFAAVGAVLLEQGTFDVAQAVYRKAGIREIPQDQLRKYCDSCLENGRLSAAQLALWQLKEEIPKEKFKQCGDKALEYERFMDAYDAYALAGTAYPQDKLVGLGHAFLFARNTEMAIAAFEKAGAVDELMTIAEDFFEREPTKAESVLAVIARLQVGKRQVESKNT